MIRHLFKLVWNRKRANALLILEVFFSFLVVFAVGALGLHLLDNYRRPLGYSWRDVWSVQLDMGAEEPPSPEQTATLVRLLAEVESLPPVEAAAGTLALPYRRGGSSGNWMIDGRQVEMELNEVTLRFDEVMDIEPVRGRWFEEGDAALPWDPIVIDEELARTVYGAEDPVGKTFGQAAPGEPERRVIGVVGDFRKDGELAAATNFMFTLKDAGDPAAMVRNLVLEIRPGTPAAFEEELVARLQGVAPDWSFEVQPLARLRESSFRERLAPLVAGAIVAFFLMIMVGLGLVGVLWQNLLRRTREMGLRRAAGASRRSIHAQVLGEQLILTTLGVLLGALLVVQLPLLELAGFLPTRVFAAGVLFAAAAIYLLTLLSSFYPSVLASRVQPAEALHHE